MKVIKSDNYVQGYYCLKGSYYKFVDDYDAFDEYGSKIQSSEPEKIEIIIPHEFNTEREVIKKDVYFKMSTEAKEVISIIINCPAELVGIVATPTKKIIKREKLESYITKKWGSDTTKKIIREIKELLSLF